MDNAKSSSDKRIREMLTRMRYIIDVQDLASEHESPYAQMLFWENLLAYRMVRILLSIEYLSNLSIKTFETGFKREYLESLGLYHLSSMVESYLASFSKDAKSTLDKFRKYRNKITHNMLYEYEDLERLNQEAIYVVKLAKEADTELSKFHEYLIDEITKIIDKDLNHV
jgi:hypothetical protein